MFPGPSELIVILVIALLVFGPKKIPEIMGGLAQGIKSFKKAMDGEETPPPAPIPEHNPVGLPPPVPVHPEAPPPEQARTE